MKATQRLHDLGQRLWLDNITRELIGNGTLSRYIGEFAITGLTSNPTIFGQAIKNGDAYDASIRQKAEDWLVCWSGRVSCGSWCRPARQWIGPWRQYRSSHHRLPRCPQCPVVLDTAHTRHVLRGDARCPSLIFAFE